jgi:alkylation response protein AidB-like acyl-CoA dehydrogenase
MLSDPCLIKTPQDSTLVDLCEQLANLADQTDLSGSWPAEQLELCARHGVYRWFLSEADGGFGWDEADIMRGYLHLGASCLNTGFVITQASGALRRVAAAGRAELKGQILPALLDGSKFSTVGISHLTTSRRHLAKPVLRAEQVNDGFRLDGISPWVTGGIHADWIVMGAQLDDGRQVLVVLPTNLPGVRADQPAELVGLTASHTGAVRLDGVVLGEQWLLAGPVENVMQGATGAKTGGLQTSALALGLARRAIEFVISESAKRPGLSEPAKGLHVERTVLEQNLLSLADGDSVCSVERLRSASNSIVLRATQAALAAAKGAGYVQGHPAGRWCREALFFLVWSCPAPVMAANLCELAGLTD